MKNITKSLKVITLASILSFGLSYVYAWTAPTSNPPAGNVSAPINTSATSQVKSGAFGVNGLLKGYVGVDTPKICLNASSDNTTNCITAWPAVGGGGTVTSLSQGTGITLSSNPITTTGTITNSGVTGLTAGSGITLSPAGPGATGVVTVTATGGIPAGAVMYFNLASCPTGWLPANGTSGTPDLRGEFIRGLDSGRGVDAGRTLGSWQADMLKSHTHTYYPPSTSIDIINQSRVVLQAKGSLLTPNTSTGATGGTETRPRNAALLACIKS